MQAFLEAARAGDLQSLKSTCQFDFKIPLSSFIDSTLSLTVFAVFAPGAYLQA